MDLATAGPSLLRTTVTPVTQPAAEASSRETELAQTATVGSPRAPWRDCTVSVLNCIGRLCAASTLVRQLNGVAQRASTGARRRPLVSHRGSGQGLPSRLSPNFNFIIRYCVQIGKIAPWFAQGTYKFATNDVRQGASVATLFGRARPHQTVFLWLLHKKSVNSGARVARGPEFSNPVTAGPRGGAGHCLR